MDNSNDLINLNSNDITNESNNNLNDNTNDNDNSYCSENDDLPDPPLAPNKITKSLNIIPNINIIQNNNYSPPSPQLIQTDPFPSSPPYSPSRSFQGCSHVADYSLKGKVGEGTYGVVHIALHKSTNQKFALKEILIHNEREGMPLTALREIRLLKQLDHPNVIRLHEIAIQKADKNTKKATLMVFPYMEHDLDGILQNPDIKLKISQVKSIIQQVLLGMDYLHSNFILHRDIKCANLLVDRLGNLKVADFGLARFFSVLGGEYTNMVVTRWCRPPELLMGATRYSAEVDIVTNKKQKTKN
ncbi:kinase-like domain-containing protein [Globomyces pollinis-pini]|nr:kinase-like domain-containing protein [Globomyces pollinis-pini]